MNLALFDFDGTLTTRDTFLPFLRFAIPPGRMLAGGFALAPVLAAHQVGLVSSARVRPWLSRAGFAGVSAQSVRELGQRFATEVIPRSVDATMLSRLKAHQENGDTVYVVSAGLDVYLQPWCDAQGVGLLCSQLEERGGALTGRYRRGDCSGAKATLVRANVDLRRFSEISAYGDTAEDEAMLALAHRRYFRGAERHHA